MKISKSRPAGIAAFAAILCAPLTKPAGAQTFDSSGNGSLKGGYFVRQVVTAKLDPNTSAIGRALSLAGVMTFDGKGNYSFAGQMVDTQAGSTAKPYSISGLYSVASNGLAQIQNPIDPPIPNTAPLPALVLWPSSPAPRKEAIAIFLSPSPPDRPPRTAP